MTRQVQAVISDTPAHELIRHLKCCMNGNRLVNLVVHLWCSNTGSLAWQELWRYSFPLHKDSVPSWSVPVIALCAPAAVIIAHSYIRQTPRLEVHNAVLNALMCVITTALITNLIKLGVRRSRTSSKLKYPDQGHHHLCL